MRNIILFVLALYPVLDADAQDTWNAVKVFELDSEYADGAYYMYIDSVGSTDGNAVFCFRTEVNSIRKVVKTDIDGKVFDVTDALSYLGLTVFNGDTLYIDNHSVINKTNGDTIFIFPQLSDMGILGMSASTNGVYIYCFHAGKRKIPHEVFDIIHNKIIYQFKNDGFLESYGLCCSGNVVYSLRNSELTYMNEDGSNKNQVIVPVESISGIGTYRGSLYAYSKTDNAVYRLDPPEVVTSVSSNRAEVEQTAYYNLLGEKTDTPSGLTTVVTRYSDGSVRTEKKLIY